MVRCDIGTVQYDDRTVKCEKKNRVPLNMTKLQSKVMLVLANVIMELLNMRKKRVLLNVKKAQ